jgi:hypothetical protein
MGGSCLGYVKNALHDSQAVIRLSRKSSCNQALPLK